MSFKLEEELPTIEWPVTAWMPQNGGGWAEKKFTALFKVLPVDEVVTFAEPGDETNPVFVGMNYENKLLDEGFVGFKGILGHDGNELESTPENMARLRNISYMRRALNEGYQKMLAGKERKN